MVALPARISRALDDFRACVASHFGERIVSLRLFGSYARGDYEAESDVDVLVVVDALQWRERRKVFDLAHDVFCRTFVHLAPLVLSVEEWDATRERELLLGEEIERDGISL